MASSASSAFESMTEAELSNLLQSGISDYFNKLQNDLKDVNALDTDAITAIVNKGVAVVAEIININQPDDMKLSFDQVRAMFDVIVNKRVNMFPNALSPDDPRYIHVPA